MIPFSHQKRNVVLVRSTLCRSVGSSLLKQPLPAYIPQYAQKYDEWQERGKDQGWWKPVRAIICWYRNIHAKAPNYAHCHCDSQRRCTQCDLKLEQLVPLVIKPNVHVVLSIVDVLTYLNIGNLTMLSCSNSWPYANTSTTILHGPGYSCNHRPPRERGYRGRHLDPPSLCSANCVSCLWWQLSKPLQIPERGLAHCLNSNWLPGGPYDLNSRYWILTKRKEVLHHRQLHPH